MTQPSPIGPATSTWLPAVTAATTPAPLAPLADDVDQPAVGWLQRHTLTEPVRVWIYSLLLVLTIGLQLAGWMTDQWAQYAVINGGVLLSVGGAGEALRTQVYSPAGVIRAARAAVAAADRR